jgi:universal stress protein A
MKMYQHVLLATDLHEENKKSALRALAIAEQNEAKLTLVHVVEPLPAYAMGYFGSVNIEQELIDEAQKNLTSLAKSLNISEDAQRIEIGSVKVSILKVAKDINADLIVVGSHGRHGLELLLGSTAAGILHGAECDVLVVRTQDE